jgi:hypothetical protein
MFWSHALSMMASCARTAYAALWGGQPKNEKSASTSAQTLANLVLPAPRRIPLIAAASLRSWNFKKLQESVLKPPRCYRQP